MRTAIIGGGAAGFFLALNLKEMMPGMQVCILERSQRVLAKVTVSGGGRCNCTNTFRRVSDVAAVYPRGHRLMKRLLKVFSQDDAYRWFEGHGVPLVVQEDDDCVFPEAQDSQAVIGCFLSLAHRYGVEIRRGCKVQSLDDVTGFDYVAVTTGGSPSGEGLRWLADLGHEIEQPVPSLFSLRVDDAALNCLQGLVVPQTVVHIAGTKLRAEVPLLLTHWGMSGPAILRLSSYAARHLADCNFQVPLSVNWTGMTDQQVQEVLYETALRQAQKRLTTFNGFGLPGRLWTLLLDRALASKAGQRWIDIGKKDINRMVNVLCNDSYLTAGRAPFRDEFVTCGGISLKAVNASTLESRHVPGLYFAGEVLDVDGVTGGFNFQAAWTTAYVVAQSISKAAAARGL